MTQGQGAFSMEFARYKRLPKNLEEETIAERKKASMTGRCSARAVYGACPHSRHWARRLRRAGTAVTDSLSLSPAL
ncbi:MAG: hypothetical protein ABSG67_13655 [Thermoguttaceae bacterium]|jgi:hypothetical protein